MALKSTVKKIEDVDEALRGAYIQKGDVWVLDVSTDELKTHPSNSGLISALDHEREQRKDAETASADILKKFDGLDPEKARAAMETERKGEDKELLDAGKVDELVERRVTAAREDFDRQVKLKDVKIGELEGAVTGHATELASMKIFGAIKDVAIDKGARPEALTDIAGRAAGMWTLGDDGKPVAMTDGNKVFGKNGNALEIPEWVEQMAESAPHLFGESKGGGGGGSQQDRGRPGDGIKMISPEVAGDNIAELANGSVQIAY